MAKKTYIGIDFGTTKTAVCKFIEGSHQPQAIPLQSGRPEVSTLIALDNKTGKVVAWGDDIENEYHKDSTQYSEFKLFAGVKGKTCQNGKSFDIVVESFLHEIYSAIKNSFNGADINSQEYQFIIGCPTEWEKLRRENFSKIIHQAGFCHFELLDESIAIARYHEWNKDIEFGNDPFFLFDFGGATMNIGIFLPHKGGFETIDVRGIEKGGRNFDLAIMELNVEQNPEFLELSNKDKFGANRYSQILKIKFSTKMALQERASVVQSWKGTTLQLNTEGFERQCMNLIQLIPQTINKMLDDKNYAPSKITKIVTSGGTSQFYFVRSELKKIFPHLGDDQIVPSSDVNLVVARGLAVSKHIETKPVNDVHPSQNEYTNKSFIPWVYHNQRKIVLTVVLVMFVVACFIFGGRKDTAEVYSVVETALESPPVITPELPPQVPIPSIESSGCWEECKGGIFGCRSHYAGGFVKITNNGASGNIVVTLEILMNKDDEWVVSGSRTWEIFLNAGQSKHFELSGSSDKIPLSDCPKKYEIKSNPKVTVP